MQAIDLLLQRQSARVTTDPAPDEGALQLMLESAVRAPDHGRLQPWRFVIIRGAGRERFGDLMAGYLARARPGIEAEALSKARKKALRAPLIIVVAAIIDRSGKIPEIEQILSAGAAAQNILLAACALGFNAVWKTGAAVYDDQVKTALGLQSKDAVVGVLYIGSEPGGAPAAPRPSSAQFVQQWGGS